jgi:hypothetical protein
MYLRFTKVQDFEWLVACLKLFVGSFGDWYRLAVRALYTKTYV